MAAAGAGRQHGFAALFFCLFGHACVLVEAQDGGPLGELAGRGRLDGFEGLVGVDGGRGFAAGGAGVD